MNESKSQEQATSKRIAEREKSLAMSPLRGDKRNQTTANRHRKNCDECKQLDGYDV